MRNLTLFLTPMMLLLAGCKPYAYFKTPNDLLNQSCTVYLTDGTVKKGMLSIQFETGRKAGNNVQLRTEKNAEEKIRIDHIKYYQLGDDYYYPKIINLEPYEIVYKDKLYVKNMDNIVFVKLLTKQNDKILFYELYQSRVGSLDGVEQHEYFVSFPGEPLYSAWNIRSSKFFPLFDEKMSSLLSDCPVLANKIRLQSDGYYAAQVSFDVKKYTIFKRIVDEYNACH